MDDPDVSAPEKQPFRGAHHPAKVYTVGWTGAGAPIALNYHDCNHGDNSGSLTMRIFGPTGG